MINIIVVDDHEVIRRGLELIFQQTPDITLAGSTDDLETTIQLLHENHQTDVLLLDLEMPKANGLTVLRKVKEEFPGIRVLIYSMHPDEIYAINCLKSGAMGYVNKSTSIEVLLGAIRKVAGGDIYLSEKLSERMAYQKRSGLAAAQRRMYKRLSVREVEVLQAPYQRKTQQTGSRGVGHQRKNSEHLQSTTAQKTERQQHGGTDQPRQKRRNAREDVPITGVTPSSNFSIGRAKPGRCRLPPQSPRAGKTSARKTKLHTVFLPLWQEPTTSHHEIPSNPAQT